MLYWCWAALTRHSEIFQNTSNNKNNNDKLLTDSTVFFWSSLRWAVNTGYEYPVYKYRSLCIVICIVLIWDSSTHFPFFKAESGYYYWVINCSILFGVFFLCSAFFLKIFIYLISSSYSQHETKARVNLQRQVFMRIAPFFLHCLMNTHENRNCTWLKF